MQKVFFIHRSVGNYLIRDGNMRRLIKGMQQPFALSDYMQNSDTLTTEEAGKAKAGLYFPDNDTTPYAYAQIFTKDVESTYKPIQDLALLYDLIVIKSCYPNSNILNEAELIQIKGYYRSIAEFFRHYPHKKLLILTSPPQIPLRTTAARAERARRLANWLEQTYLGPNVLVFNFFDLLADPQKNWLKRGYRRRFLLDAHPNAKADREIAPLLVRRIVEILTT